MIQIRVGKQKKKEKKKIYTENKIGRYVQFLIEREDFLERVASWLLSIEDERMQLLRQFIFEVELSETEELKNVLYQYGVISQRKTIWRESFSNTWQSWCGKWNRIAGQRLCRQQ